MRTSKILAALDHFGDDGPCSAISFVGANPSVAPWDEPLGPRKLALSHQPTRAPEPTVTPLKRVKPGYASRFTGEDRSSTCL